MNLRRHVTILSIAAIGATGLLGTGIAYAAPTPQTTPASTDQPLPKWFLEAGISTNNRCDPPETIDVHTVELPCNAEYDVWVQNNNHTLSTIPIVATVQADVTGPQGLHAETYDANTPNSSPIESADLHQGEQRKFDLVGNHYQGISLHVKSLSSPDYPDELVKVIITG